MWSKCVCASVCARLCVSERDSGQRTERQERDETFRKVDILLPLCLFQQEPVVKYFSSLVLFLTFFHFL